MKIQPLILGSYPQSRYSKGVVNKTNYYNDSQIHSPLNNKVNFKGFWDWLLSTEQTKTVKQPLPKPKPIIQLYRVIREDEYKRLLAGETINQGGLYTTSDSKGWQARDWNSGYNYNGENNLYFVTFKKDSGLKYEDRRDNKEDTRYGIFSYSLSDVKNIKEGFNINGKIVYGSPQEKLNDMFRKSDEIRAGLAVIGSNKSPKEREDAWDVLSSFAKEYPIEEFPQLDFSDQTTVNGLALYMRNSQNPIYKNLAKKCIDSVMKHPDMKLSVYLTTVFAKYGDIQDVPKIIKLLENRRISSFNAASALDAISKNNAECEKSIIKDLNSKNGDKMTALALYLTYRNDDFKYNNIYRDMLNKIAKNKIREGAQPHYLPTIVETAAKQLAREGNFDDIAILRKHFSPEHPDNFPSLEVKQAMDIILAQQFDVMIAP